MKGAVYGIFEATTQDQEWVENFFLTLLHYFPNLSHDDAVIYLLRSQDFPRLGFLMSCIPSSYNFMVKSALDNVQKNFCDHGDIS